MSHSRGDGVSVGRVAGGFGVYPVTLNKWLRQHRIDTGEQSGTTTIESVALNWADRWWSVFGGTWLRQAVTYRAARP
ncbi:hypothetical protein M0E87_03880 [Corynebacterium sp. CCM 9185]|uniref:Transposase n=1 Tax=Corynebacterium marambiense TaxID=2765364 RepID=A0ABS0W020_9CORY|nr:hypothetical protein [Corynebacterium marambiense]MBI9000927.1 hypothetical protein [Corynebacterium marambiense]MCK7662802.1 hypothetical protein [Corynebacterium marambiense]MCX7542411.1 hypothetical protein [Corynebacterium marambiense]